MPGSTGAAAVALDRGSRANGRVHTMLTAVKRASLSNCAGYVLSLSAQGFRCLCDQMRLVTHSDAEAGLLRGEMLRALEWWWNEQQPPARGGSTARSAAERTQVARDMEAVRCAALELLRYMALRAMVDNLGFVQRESALTGQASGPRAQARVAVDFCNRVLGATPALRSILTRTVVKLFGDEALSPQERQSEVLWAALRPGLRALVERLCEAAGLTVAPSSLQHWRQLPLDLADGYRLAYADVLEIAALEHDGGEVQVDKDEWHKTRTAGQGSPEELALTEEPGESTGKEQDDDYEDDLLLVDAEAAAVAAAAAAEQLGGASEAAQRPPKDSRRSSSSSSASASGDRKEGKHGRRISFASEAELEQVHDIPKYSKDERADLFYSTQDIRGFLVELASEELLTHEK